MQYEYQTKGTCSKKMIIELDGENILSVKIIGGCAGNTAGLSEIVRGMKAEEVIRRFDGIRCGMRPTSCPDQLARALKEAMKAQKTEN